MAISLAAVGAAAAAVAAAYPVIDQFIKDKGAKRASRVRKELNEILNKYNVELEDLKNGLEMRGIRYNTLISKLSGSSPAGRANKILNKVEYNYRKQNADDLKTIRDINKKASAISTEKEAEAQRKENTGASELFTNLPKAVRTIFS